MEHVRIDDGVKRGPRRKGSPPRPNSRPRPSQVNSQAAAVLHRPTILQALSEGRMLRDIAAELDISPAAISQYLAADPDYQAARETGIATQLDDWQTAMRDADSPLNLARAREVFRAVAWRGEREYPARWAQRSHVVVEHVGDLAERLRRARERVVDGSSVAIEQPKAIEHNHIFSSTPSDQPDLSHPSNTKD